MSTLRVGVAGAHRGQYFIEAPGWCEHADSTAICDTDSARPEQPGSSLCDASRFTDCEQMLDSQPDAVIVNCAGKSSCVQPELDGSDSRTLPCCAAKGAMTELRDGMSSPRPPRGCPSLQGTRGCYEPDWGFSGVLADRVSSHPADRSHTELESEPLGKYEEQFLPEIWRNRPAALESRAHGETDGLTILSFIEAIINDTPSRIDVYRALDMTVPGLVSEISAHQSGALVAVPNFRHL